MCYETSLTFTYTAVVCEVLLLVAAKCQGAEVNRVARALIIAISRVDNDSKYQMEESSRSQLLMHVLNNFPLPTLHLGSISNKDLYVNVSYVTHLHS